MTFITQSLTYLTEALKSHLEALAQLTKRNKRKRYNACYALQGSR